VSALGPDLFDHLLDELAERVARRLREHDHERAEAPGGEGTSPWMAIERAAAYLDLPKQRLYRLTAAGEIPHYKQEGRLLFHRGELDAWLARFGEGERGWMDGGGGS
jgi:excisionase family DNA binding protein